MKLKVLNYSEIILSYFPFCAALVNKHIKISIHSTGTTERVFLPRYSGEYPVIEYNRPKFTGWPTIREFTIELGAEKIDEYLASFNTNEEWLYIIYYVGLKTENTSEFYEYQVTIWCKMVTVLKIHIFF